jgi:hypothetical protein
LHLAGSPGITTINQRRQLNLGKIINMLVEVTHTMSVTVIEVMVGVGVGVGVRLRLRLRLRVHLSSTCLSSWVLTRAQTGTRGAVYNNSRSLVSCMETNAPMEDTAKYPADDILPVYPRRQ